jgi:methyl-accepting chemotaxis protein
MVVMTSKLNDQTEEALRYAAKQNHHSCAAGPAMIVFAFTVIRGVTGPVLLLLDATRKLKAGNLDHRITGLKDEFGELAVAFNDMAHSLRANMRAIEESEKRYRLLFESAADAIFILEAEGEQRGRIVQVTRRRRCGHTVENSRHEDTGHRHA